MEHVDAKCLMCGKTYIVAEDHKDFKKVSDKEKPGTYICDICANRVRYEADDKKKTPKPQNN
jgi:uncharacterized protein YlaI